ncbi:dynamin family protein [Actinoplanes aureus]|uniref:Dynamin family protein n=1 Tax=Actinoplanes aureus TaxID=2792083 RepID=A0A931G249_9ACTN|nr:dynamin family protein [Actinoplanes aureus]MBG0568663.1 dynamin family protein [Actinoplanes aureus]
MPEPFTLAVVSRAPAEQRRFVHDVLADTIGAVGALHSGTRVLPVPIEFRYAKTPSMRRWAPTRTGDRPTPARLWDPGDLDVPNLRRVDVALPARLLDRWDCRLLVLPTTCGGAELDTLPRENMGILFVRQPRGSSDVEEELEEHLRDRVGAVVEPLLAPDLTARRSELRIEEFPGATVPFVLPLVTARFHPAAADESEESELLRLTVAALRAAPQLTTQIRTGQDGRRERLRSLGAAWVDNTARLASTAQNAMPDDYARRIPTVTKALDRITVVAGLADAIEMRRLRRRLARRLHEYNEEGPVVEPVVTEDPPLPPGTGYAHDRNLLAGLLRAAAGDESLGLTEQELASFGGLSQRVEEDRVEIAVMGRFSSGKSSVINAMLEVENNDRDPVLLPTNVKRETSTINIIEWAPERSLLGIDLLTATELRFLRPSGIRDGFKVAEEEVAAFAAWRASGEVASGDFVVTDMSPDGRDYAVAASRDDESFRRILDTTGGTAKFVYPHRSASAPQLPGAPVARSARIDRFDQPPPPLGASDLKTALRAVAVPSYALRVHHLRIGYNHPLLKHVSFIDTPGSDAPVPHHREMARRIIAERKCPVIYCFDGTGSFEGKEDTANLRFLASCGVGQESSRFFFVLTRRGSLDPQGTDARKQETLLKDHMERMGVGRPVTYFVETRTRNQAFDNLAEAVGKYVATIREPRLLAWIDEARHALAEVARRHEAQLEQSRLREQARKAAADRLRSQHRRMKRILDDLETSPGWGRFWAREQVGSRLQQLTRPVQLTIEGLVDKDAFDDVETTLEGQFATLNTGAEAQVREVLNGMAGKFATLVAEALPEQSIARPPYTHEEVFFTAETTLGGAGRAIWHSLWDRIFNGESRAKDITDNRGRIENPWNVSCSAGHADARRLVDEHHAQLRAEGERVAGSVAAELAALEAPADLVSADVLRDRHDLAQRYRRLLGDLRRRSPAP